MNKQVVSHLWGVQYRTVQEYHYPLLSARTFRSTWRRFLALVGLSGLVVGFNIFPNVAFADPHATFFTDRAQEQLFFNVLAALNQADYVEPPDRPPIDADRRLGDFIRQGTYVSNANQPQYQTVRDPVTGQLTVRLLPGSGFPLEPNEATADVQLPRIRVRQVTSDDGDVYFRERVERRARAEEIRVLLAYIGCKAAEQIFGPDTAEKNKYCPDAPTGVSPGNLPFVL